MPVYDYAPDSGACAECGGCFTVLQRISDPKLGTCPQCGQTCRRLIGAPAIVGGTASANAIERAGFTQYRRIGHGTYERTLGSRGPDHLFAD